MQKQHQLATWNSEKDFWENGEDIFGHSDVYSETWPISGMTVNGVAYELPMLEPRTGDSAYSSLLPTVTTSESTGPGSGPNKTGGDNLRTVVALLPTPRAAMRNVSREDVEKQLTKQVMDRGRPRMRSMGNLNLEDVIQLLPSPAVRDHKHGTIRREPRRPNDTDALAPTPTGVSMQGLFVDGKPCEEPRLPL